MSRLSTAFSPFRDVQIQAFPGATARTLFDALQNSGIYLTPGGDPIPKLVILSLGINHRSISPSTSEKELGKLISKAVATWPNAKIFFQYLNYPRTIITTPAHQNNLSSFNHSMIRRIKSAPSVGYITPLPSSRFQTTPDGIHWTGATAQAMIDHWYVQLKHHSVIRNQ